MTLAIHHIAINARNPTTIAALYAEAVGFSRVDARGPATWLATPNAFIALFPTTVDATAIPPRVCDPGIGHLCIQSGDGEANWDRLTEAGIAFNARPAALGTGVIYAYGRDPEGNLIEIEGLSDAQRSAPPWIAHVALVSADLERLADHYARLIGRAAHREGVFSHPAFKQITGFDDVRVGAKWIMADNMVLEMWRYLQPPTLGVAAAKADAPGYRHIGFCCDDLDREMARLADVGIGLSCPAAAIGGLRSASGRDPDGNCFVIVETPPASHPLTLGTLTDPDVVANRNRHLLGDAARALRA